MFVKVIFCFYIVQSFGDHHAVSNVAILREHNFTQIEIIERDQNEASYLLSRSFLKLRTIIKLQSSSLYSHFARTVYQLWSELGIIRINKTLFE